MPVTNVDGAGIVARGVDPMAGYGQAAKGRAEGGLQAPVPLRSTKVDVRVRAGFATVTTVRTFENVEERPIEATLTHPVPVDAVVHGLRVTVDGRVVAGVAQAKAKARATYEAAVDEGRTAVLHEEALKGVHVLSVAHVPPGKAVVTEVTWSKPLTFTDGGARLRVPTTVAQVYGRLPLLPADDLVTSDDLVFEAEVTVSVEGGSAVLARHGRTDGTPVKVRLDAPIDVLVDGDAATAGRLEGTASEGRRVTLDVARGAPGEARLDVSVLFDRSGSMGAGVPLSDGGSRTKWDLAREGVEAAFRTRVRAGDRVVLWQFDDRHERVGESVDGTAWRLAGAIGPHRGGTDTGGAIDRAHADGTRDVLVLTDGQSGLALTHLAARGVRVSAVLIGANSLDATIGHLVALTGGQVIVAGEEVGDAVGSILGTLRHPGTPATSATGTDLPEGMFERRAGADLTVRVGAGAAGDAAVDAVGAYAAFLALPTMTEEAATACAVAHGLCSHLTSLVMVDEVAEAQRGVPAQRKVPLSRPVEAAMGYGAVAAGAPMMASATAFVSKGLMPSSASFGGTERMRGVRGALRGFASRASHEGPTSLFSTEGATAGWATTSTDWSDATFDSVRGNVPTMPTAPTVPFPPHPTLPPSGGRGASARPDLLAVARTADWDADGNRLSLGDASGLTTPSLLILRAAAADAEVARVAAATGRDAVAVAIGLAARIATGRGAERVARRLLAGVSEADVTAMLRSLGLR